MQYYISCEQVTYSFKNKKNVILKFTRLMLFKKLKAVLLNNMLRNFAKIYNNA